jgi:hypothetical protein
MREERGQAIVIAALLIAIGALAIVGLRAAQDRILSSALAQSAGEAAVEAAAAAVGDAYAAHLAAIRARASESPPPRPDIPGLLAQPATREAARAAAAAAARANGAPFTATVDARCAGRTIEVELRHDGRVERAAIAAAACFPR